MVGSRLFGLAAGSFFLVACGSLARGEEPAKSVAPQPMSDQIAGKGADLDKIGHSPRDGSPYLGPRAAPVVVNVFSDFQCPVCTRAADPVKQLVLDFPDKVKVVFRQNALPMHPRALPAAVAALAAGKQGKFWQYHDRLFANPRALDDASLRRIASDLGLDLAQWDKDVADPRVALKVREESAAAIQVGALGTPGILVNGIRQAGWSSYWGLRQIVQREIAATEALVASGTALPEAVAQRIRTMAGKNPPEKGAPPVNADEWVKVLLAD